MAKASAIEFSPDGRLFAGSGTRTGEAGPSVTLWKTAPLAEIAKLPGAASELTFSPDSQTLAAIHSDKVVLWEINSQVVHATLKPPQLDAGGIFTRRSPNSFSPDGKLFAIADTMHVQLWDTATGELVGLLAGPRETIRDSCLVAGREDPGHLEWAQGQALEYRDASGADDVRGQQWSGLALLCPGRQPDGGGRREHDSLVADRTRPERTVTKCRVLQTVAACSAHRLTGRSGSGTRYRCVKQHLP